MPSPLDRQALREGFEAFRRYINPLIHNRAAIAGEPVRLVGTSDGRLVDAEGHTVEDFHGTQFLGHRNPAITRAVRDYLDGELPSWWPSRVSPHAGLLAKRLSERTGYDSVFFGMSGSDVVEAAIKLGRACTGKPGVVGLEGAYHGCTLGSLSLMERGLFTERFAPHLPGVRSVPLNDVDALRTELERGDVGAVVVEPIQGEGGVRELAPDFVQALCTLTDEHGALLIADEVQTGLGRTGEGFLYTRTWPRPPDVVLLAKALGGGLAPLAALLTRADLFQRAYGGNVASGEAHNYTFSYNSLGAVAGLAALDVIDDALITEVKDKGAWFKAELEAALKGHPLVEEVRGRGLLLGLKLRETEQPWLTFEHFGFDELRDKSAMGPLLCHRLYRHGFFCFTCGHDWSVFRLQPRAAIPRKTLSRFTEHLVVELDALAEVAQ